MIGHSKTLISKKTALLVCIAIFSGHCTMISDMNRMKKPRYELGQKSGPQACKECHETIYNQWKNNSRHAIAKSAASYKDFLHKFKNNFLLNSMMGAQMCNSCHGPSEDGVDCETCHGNTSPDKEVMQTHKEKYSLNIKHMKDKTFCANCHSIKNPMSGDFMVNTHNDWANSPAAKSGKTCQSCHMHQRNYSSGDHTVHLAQAYHGFDSAIRLPGLYKEKLSVKVLQASSSKIILQITNHISGHPVPAGGPTRVLALQVLCYDAGENLLYTKVQKFHKTFSLMGGLMPDKLLEDNRLGPLETRKINFYPPVEIRQNISKIVITLNLYEVSDEHMGELTKAHFKSNDIIHFSKKLN